MIHLIKRNSRHNSIENSAANDFEMMQNIDSSIVGMQKPTQPVQLLLETSKSPSSPQQKPVLVILNAQIIPTLKRRRITQQQKPLQQDHQHKQEIQILLNEGNMTENQTTSCQVLLNSDTSTYSMQMPTDAAQQLVEALNSGSSAEKILHILKANPPLMSAFEKQRTQKQEKQQSLQQKQMLLNESNMKEIVTKKSHHVLPISVTSTAGKSRPTHVFVQLAEALKCESSAPQQILDNLKANPQLMSAFNKQSTTQKQEQQQPIQKEQQQSQMLLNESNMTGNVTKKSHQVLPNSDPSTAGMSRPTLVFNQLVEALKSDSSAPQQILDNLKASPPLMSDLKKQSTTRKQEQQQPLQQEQQQQREILLNDGNVTRNETKKSGQLLLNSDTDPSTVGMQNPIHAFQQLVEALKSKLAAQKQQEVLAILKANPPLVAALKKQIIVQKEQQQKSLQQVQQQHRQMLPCEGNTIISETNNKASHQVLPNSDPSTADVPRPSHVFPQLAEALKSESSAQELEVLAVFKADPTLVTALRKQTTEQQQQRQMLLNEGNMTEIQTDKPHPVLPNSDPSTARMQKPAQAFQQVVGILKSSPSAQQPQQVLTASKVKQQLIAAFLKPGAAQKQKKVLPQHMQQQVLTIPKANPLFLAAFNERRAAEKQKQLLQQPKQQQMLLNKGSMTENPTTRACQVFPNPGHSITSVQRYAKAWKQIQEILKSPSSAQQQEQILAILKANPKLIAAFINQRTADKKQQKRHMLLNEDIQNIESDELVLNERNSDNLEVRRKQFNCHKCILGAGSTAFAAMERTAGDIMAIKDSGPTAFQEFLLYLYTTNKKHLSWKNVTDRYKLANKYCVGNMEKLCAEYIKENITTENFYDFFLLSKMHNDREIIDITIQFFLQKSDKIAGSKTWAIFVTENPVESDELVEALCTLYGM